MHVFNGLVYILTALPLCILIHEIGHIIAVLIVGGKPKSLTIGIGPELNKKGFFRLKILYFLVGSFKHDYGKNHSKGKEIFVLLGGVLANLITML